MSKERTDTERINWLDGTETDGPGQRFNRAWREWDGYSHFRQAIDKAMDAEVPRDA